MKKSYLKRLNLIMETNQQINIWVLYHILDDETHIWIKQSHYIWFVFMGKKYIEKMKFLDFKIKVHYNPNNLTISMLLHLGLHQLLVQTKQIPLSLVLPLLF